MTNREALAERDEWWIDLTWPAILGGNLGVSGALCLSYSIGYQSAQDEYWDGECWLPGCGDLSPGSVKP